MQNLIELAETLDARALPGVVTLALIGFLAFIFCTSPAAGMTPLFTNLSLDDSAAIAKELDRAGAHKCCLTVRHSAPAMSSNRRLRR